MCTAEDIGIDIMYQDTDSMHLYKDDLEPLRTEFQKRYNRELIGSSMGQFHSDFAMVGGCPPVAMKSIFVMKKGYIDELRSVDFPKGIDKLVSEGGVAYHCRMKGVPIDVVAMVASERYNSKCWVGEDGLVYGERSSAAFPLESGDDSIDERSSVNFPSGIEKLYEDLYNGDTIEFDLAKGSRPSFDMRGDFSIQTKTKFIRKIKA